MLVALIGLLSALCVQIDVTDANQLEITEEYLRPRLGHFAAVGQEIAYIDFYGDYFEKVLKVRDTSLKHVGQNAWKTSRPTAEFCLDFLTLFRTKGGLEMPYDIIPLDACLGWLLDDSDDKKFDVDQLSDKNKNKLNDLAKDAQFRQIYESTAFKNDTLPWKVLDDLHVYLAKLMLIHAKSPYKGCHSVWMDTHNRFIERAYLSDCESETDCHPYGIEHSDEDSYLRLITESTRNAVTNCYEVMLQQMPAIWKKHRKSDESKLQNWLHLGKHPEPEQNVQVLRVLSGCDNGKSSKCSVDIVAVAEELQQVKKFSTKAVKNFTDAIANYAKRNVDLAANGGDPLGQVRYGKALTRLCESFIDKEAFKSQTGGATVDEGPAKKDKPMNVYPLISSLIKVTNHEPIFHISKEQFQNDVVNNNWTPLYLTTLACQIMATSLGYLNYNSNEGSYDVNLDMMSSIMYEDWPIDVIVSRLREGKKEPAKKKTSIFGRKSSSQSTSDSKDAKEASDSDDSPPASPKPKGGLFWSKKDKKQASPEPSSPDGDDSDDQSESSATSPDTEQSEVQTPVARKRQRNLSDEVEQEQDQLRKGAFPAGPMANAAPMANSAVGSSQAVPMGPNMMPGNNFNGLMNYQGYCMLPNGQPGVCPNMQSPMGMHFASPINMMSPNVYYSNIAANMNGHMQMNVPMVQNPNVGFNGQVPNMNQFGPVGPSGMMPNHGENMPQMSLGNSNQMMSNQMMNNQPMMAHNQMMNGNQMMANNQMMTNNQVMSSNQMMSNNQMMNGNQMMPNNQMAPNNQMMSGNQMANMNTNGFNAGTQNMMQHQAATGGQQTNVPQMGTNGMITGGGGPQFAFGGSAQANHPSAGTNGFTFGATDNRVH